MEINYSCVMASCDLKKEVDPTPKTSDILWGMCCVILVQQITFRQWNKPMLGPLFYAGEQTIALNQSKEISLRYY